MATELGLTNVHSLIELAKRTYNKEVLPIAMVLAENRPILQHAVWREANGVASHVHTRDIDLPAGDWRAINNGIDGETGLTKQIEEPIKLLEARSEIDEMLMKLAPNARKYRMEEDMMFLEGLGQTFESAFFYGDPAIAAGDPDKIRGITERPEYDASAEANVWNMSGVAADTQTSIFAVQ